MKWDFMAYFLLYNKFINVYKNISHKYPPRLDAILAKNIKSKSKHLTKYRIYCSAQVNLK